MKATLQKIKFHAGNAIAPARASLNKAIADAPPELRKRVKKFLIGAILLIVLIIAYKWFVTFRDERARRAEIEAGPQVKVATSAQSPGTHLINLIGETRPYSEATLYAKVSGYLKAVKVDKGDFVKAGQVLAIIESPETDQEYAATVADAKNKEAIEKRMSTLFQKQLVSQQEADQAKADADVSAARRHTSEILKSYETLRAPFAGTVTARFADPGALVQNATNSQTSALPVVTISTIDKLRVVVFVDQHDAPFIAKDDPIEITLNDRPGFKILGKVARASGSLDPRTKMLLTEIEISNEKKELVAGSFVNVQLKVKSPPYIQAPVEALVMKGTDAMVTVVNAQNQLTYKKVVIANNDGKNLWIAGGLNAGETVALNVGDVIPEGGKVRPLPPEPTTNTAKAPDGKAAPTVAPTNAPATATDASPAAAASGSTSTSKPAGDRP